MNNKIIFAIGTVMARPHTKEPVENELSDILDLLSRLTVIWTQKQRWYDAVQSILLLSKDF